MSASAHAIPILVIDDDPTSLELAALERPAVVLTDFHFAIAMSGLDATRRLKADPLTAASRWWPSRRSPSGRPSRRRVTRGLTPT